MSRDSLASVSQDYGADNLYLVRSKENPVSGLLVNIPEPTSSELRGSDSKLETGRYPFNPELNMWHTIRHVESVQTAGKTFGEIMYNEGDWNNLDFILFINELWYHDYSKQQLAFQKAERQARIYNRENPGEPIPRDIRNKIRKLHSDNKYVWDFYHHNPHKAKEGIKYAKAAESMIDFIDARTSWLRGRYEYRDIDRKERKIEYACLALEDMKDEQGGPGYNIFRALDNDHNLFDVYLRTAETAFKQEFNYRSF